MSNAKQLTHDDVLEIFRRCQEKKELQGKIASDFAVSQATVSGIKRGQYWNRITGMPRRRPLTPLQQRTVDIYNAYWEHKRQVHEIAVEYGVTVTSVYNIRNGLVGAHLTGHPTPKKA